jgi:hypothetical protein
LHQQNAGTKNDISNGDEINGAATLRLESKHHENTYIPDKLGVCLRSTIPFQLRDQSGNRKKTTRTDV